MLAQSFMKFIKLQMKKKVRGRGKENVQPAQRSAAESEALSEAFEAKSICFVVDIYVLPVNSLVG